MQGSCNPRKTKPRGRLVDLKRGSGAVALCVCVFFFVLPAQRLDRCQEFLEYCGRSFYRFNQLEIRSGLSSDLFEFGNRLL